MSERLTGKNLLREIIYRLEFSVVGNGQVNFKNKPAPSFKFGLVMYLKGDSMNLRLG